MRCFAQRASADHLVIACAASSKITQQKKNKTELRNLPLNTSMQNKAEKKTRKGENKRARTEEI